MQEFLQSQEVPGRLGWIRRVHGISNAFQRRIGEHEIHTSSTNAISRAIMKRASAVGKS